MKKLTRLALLFALVFVFACNKSLPPAEEYKTALLAPKKSPYYKLEAQQAEQLIHQIVKTSFMNAAVKAFVSYEAENGATNKYVLLDSREKERKTVDAATVQSVAEITKTKETVFKEYDPFATAQYFYDYVFVTAYAMGLESFLITFEDNPVEFSFDYPQFLEEVQQSAVQTALGGYSSEQDKIRTVQFITGYKLLMHEYDSQQDAVIDDLSNTTPQERAQKIYNEICAANTCVK